MPTVAINIQINSIGVDALTFTIADNVSGIIATNVPRTSLLGGIVVDADSTASEIIIAANSPCESDVTIPIDFKPCAGPTPPPPPPTPPPTPPPPPPPVTVTSVFGYMQPCIGGTIDDYQGAAVFVDSPVSVDTTFDVTVYWVLPGNTCTSTLSNTFSIFIPNGETSSSFNACTNGYYISTGAVICGACINSCDNPQVDFSAVTC